MAVSNDTLSLILHVERFRQAGGNKELPGIKRTMKNVEQFKLVEPKLSANSTGNAINLAEIGGTVHGIIISTPKKIGVKLNGAATAEICGSIKVTLDTTITQLVLDNNLLGDPGEEVRPEVWLVAAPNP